MRAIEDVLETYEKEAKVLRRHGSAALAESIEQMVHDIRQSSITEYLTWVSEVDARRRTGHAPPWFRARFPEWQEQGHARIRFGKREYRLAILPQRRSESVAYEAGRRGAA